MIFIEIMESHLTTTNTTMNITKEFEPPERQLEKYITSGLTPEEARRFLQIHPHSNHNGRREHKSVTERLLKFRETLRRVNERGLDELARATVRKDQWGIVEFYVFQEVIRDFSRTDTIALAEYSLWVFYGMEVQPETLPPASAANDDNFGSLESVFGNIVFDK